MWNTVMVLGSMSLMGQESEVRKVVRRDSSWRRSWGSWVCEVGEEREFLGE